MLLSDSELSYFLVSGGCVEHGGGVVLIKRWAGPSGWGLLGYSGLQLVTGGVMLLPGRWLLNGCRRPFPWLMLRTLLTSASLAGYGLRGGSTSCDYAAHSRDLKLAGTYCRAGRSGGHFRYAIGVNRNCRGTSFSVTIRTRNGKDRIGNCSLPGMLNRRLALAVARSPSLADR